MYWLIGLVVLYVLIKDGIRRDKKRRRSTPGTDEWFKASLEPGAGIEKD